MTKQALKYIGVRRPGGIAEIAFTTRLFLFTNKTSMGKLMKNVCMELQGFRIIASPCLKFFLPSRPLILGNNLSAIIASSAKTAFLVLLIIFIVI